MKTAMKLTDEQYATQFENTDPGVILDSARAVFEGEPLRRIQVARDRLETAERELVDAVRFARKAGVTWQAIGGLLGMTRQGAQSYYAGRI
ncbi:hypothetical protein [Mobiluncus porci]|uniref:Uncharacterized protein n=1 Tax=Mobiluncus porci TaxID=2652278 RepID=A0A7K0K0U4_9ACTO|nr:hypothetical protein [Mobiluncus porci]MST49039.1 hypothetical protein [Mobiluncus porci]